MSNWFLRNVLYPRLSEGLLRNILSPGLSERSLRNVFNISLLNGWWLNDLDVLNWICWRNDSFDFLSSFVLDLFPWLLFYDSVIIEGISIIEVLI